MAPDGADGALTIGQDARICAALLAGQGAGHGEPRRGGRGACQPATGLNPDPALSGWWPYAKDRNPNGGTAFHKFAGANFALPDMMALLYPEVDLEVLGAPTGNDPRVFPGMLSDRDLMWERAERNTMVTLRDAVAVEIVEGPTLVDASTARRCATTGAGSRTRRGG